MADSTDILGIKFDFTDSGTVAGLEAIQTQVRESTAVIKALVNATRSLVAVTKQLDAAAPQLAARINAQHATLQMPPLPHWPTRTR